MIFPRCQILYLQVLHVQFVKVQYPFFFKRDISILADIPLLRENDSFLLCQLEKMISSNFRPTTYSKLSAFQF